MTSLFPPFNRRAPFRKLPYFFEAGRGVYYKSTGIASPSLALDFTTGVLDPRITFSRASNATLTDSTGKITYAPNNLALQSQALATTPWSTFNQGTGTAPVRTNNYGIAPDGSTTATRIQLSLGGGTTTSDRSLVTQSVPVQTGVQYIYSVYVRSLSGTVSFSFQSDGINAAVTTRTATESWQRFTVVGPSTTTPLSIGVQLRGGQSPAHSNTVDLLVWGAQVEAVTYETTPRTYNPTTTAVYYGPRFDYDPNTLVAKGLLIEEARTNFMTDSNTSAAWSLLGTATVTANSGISPDGTNNAILVTNATTISPPSGGSSIYRVATGLTSNTAHTASIYVKAVTATTAAINIFDASTGGNTTQSIALTSSWQRVSVTRTLGAATTAVRVTVGDANGTFLIFGLQLEAGAFATSYIPTVAATVARSADIATMTGTNFSSWFNQGAGTFVAKADAYSVTAYSALAVARLSSTGIQNRIDLSTNGTSATTAPRITVTVANVTQADLSATVPAMSPNTAYTFAGAFATNDFISASQGALSTNDTSGAVPAPDILDIGNRNNTLQLNGHLQYIRYYRTRLPNAQLQVLTS